VKGNLWTILFRKERGWVMRSNKEIADEVRRRAAVNVRRRIKRFSAAAAILGAAAIFICLQSREGDKKDNTIE